MVIILSPPLFAMIYGGFGSRFGGYPSRSDGRFTSDGTYDPSQQRFSDSEPVADPFAVSESSLARLERLATEDQVTKSQPAGSAAAVSAQEATRESQTTETVTDMMAPVQQVVATPVVTTAAATESLPEIAKDKDGYWQISFQNLASFPYALPPPDSAPTPGAKKDIPENIQSLDGKPVCLSGYMLPIQMGGGLVKEFLLIRSPMFCCYGVVPAPNEWVVVKMKGKGTAPMMDVPLNFYGTLHIGELYEDRMFTGIYQLDGEKVSVN
ncbi:DUF3299 domain-containing protein [Termitidicoccus mucosus]|uniref:DUF3299 domain-containing protein n=1 Tax=Termitidicoccus mucosus TaxID=1184151 RepID=A0A178IL54_9BACT|nr:hypothetical protein AW736_07955 [Opitutaceae bacterium TSB47]